MEYIEAGGQKRPFRFAWKAVKTLMSEVGIDRLAGLQELEKVADKPENITAILRIGFEHGAKSEGEEIAITDEMVDDWIDEDFGLIERGVQAFARQLTAATGAKKNTKAAPKKKKS